MKNKGKLTTMDENLRVPFNPYPNWPVDIKHEVFVSLIDSEVDFLVPESYCDNEDSKGLRRFAVEYIEEIYLRNMDEKFDALIPHMAMTYFDRFYSGGDIPLVAGDVQKVNTTLCLICCLTIAWKLRTKNSNIPQFLVDHQIQFTMENMLTMELHIVKRLNWRLQAPTPLSYVKHLLKMADLPTNSPSPLHPLRQLIIRSQHDVAFAKYRPSVVAATATVVVTKAVFSAHRFNRQTRIYSSKLLDPNMKMMLKCEEKLQSVFIDLTKPAAAGECSSSSSGKEEPPLGEIRATLAESMESDPDKNEVMKFELGWAEALKKLDACSAPAAVNDDADGTSNLAQRLAECCNGCHHGCHIL